MGVLAFLYVQQVSQHTLQCALMANASCCSLCQPLFTPLGHDHEFGMLK